jgi:hypothetical protein
MLGKTALPGEAVVGHRELDHTVPDVFDVEGHP